MPQDKIRKAKQHREKYQQRKALAREILGGCCVDCGSTKDLEFDHIESGMHVSTIIMNRWDSVLKQLAKCELRCRTCHRARHGLS